MKNRQTAIKLSGAAAVVLLAACLTAETLSAFFSHDPGAGESMYTYSGVRAHFAAFAPAYIALPLLLILLCLLNACFSATKKSADARLYKRAPSISKNRQTVLRISLFALSAVLIVLGIINGGLRDVFVKAVNICTECIGLG